MRPCLLGCDRHEDNGHIHTLRCDQPLFSQERYAQELSYQKRKEDKAFEKRLELIREKEQAEDIDIALHQVGNSSAPFDV